MQLLADDPETGRGNLRSQPHHADLLEQIVVFDLALPGERDERVLVGRLLQRPRRMASEKLKGRKRGRPADEEVQRDRNLQARQMRSREGQVWRRRQIHPAVRREHARAFAEIQRRVGDVLDHGVRQHEIEGAVGKRQRHAVGHGELRGWRRAARAPGGRRRRRSG